MKTQLPLPARIVSIRRASCAALKRNMVIGMAACFICSSAYAQYYYNAFEGEPSFGSLLPVEIDSMGLWQIGPPMKALFDEAFSPPNVLVTDTVGFTPAFDTSRVHITVPVSEDEFWFYYGIAAFKWVQKIDFDSLSGGMVEFSRDGGDSWENAFDSPYVYNYYGFDSANEGQLPDGTAAFTGTDDNWREVWLCFEYSWLIETIDTIRVRLTFISDSIGGTHEGWMIDNMILEPTIVHTVDNVEQEDYLLVYPNPGRDRLHVSAKKTEGFHIIESLELMTEQGVILKRYSKIPTRFFIDTSDLKAGTYIMRVVTNLKTEVHRVIVSN